MKYQFAIAAVILLLGSGLSHAQKYGTKTGQIQFEASVPSFEAVGAQHNNVSAILNTETGEIAVLALVTGFRFKVALMEEHFNENYMESETYPKAVFRGVLKEFNADQKEGTSQYTLEGTISMHGVSQKLSVPIALKSEAGNYYLTSSFKLRPEDFEIDIPKVVANKIAQEVIVSVALPLNAL